MAPAAHQPQANAAETPAENAASTDQLLRSVLARFPQLETALLFGSVARSQAHAHSDLDLAVLAPQAKQAIIEALAAACWAVTPPMPACCGCAKTSPATPVSQCPHGDG